MKAAVWVCGSILGIGVIVGGAFLFYEYSHPERDVVNLTITVEPRPLEAHNYNLQLSAPDASNLGADNRVVADQYGIFVLPTEERVTVSQAFEYCLEQAAPIKDLTGEEVAVVPAGTCMSGGALTDTPTVQLGN